MTAHPHSPYANKKVLGTPPSADLRHEIGPLAGCVLFSRGCLRPATA